MVARGHRPMRVEGPRGQTTVRSRTRVPLGIGVVIPTYGPGTYLQETLRSLERQTLPPADVVLVDDGSDPPVRMPQTSLPLRLVRIHHAGITAARNAGVGASSTALVHILDHDDRVEPEFYERVTEVFTCRSEADVVHTAYGVFDADGAPLHGRSPEHPPDYASAGHAVRDLITINRVGSVAAVFRRSVFDELDGFRSFDFVQDWDFWLRAALAGRSFCFVPDVLAWHRVHDQQQSGGPRGLLLVEEAIRMLRTLDLPPASRLARGRRVASLRLQLAGGQPGLNRRALRHLASALVLRPRGTLATMRAVARRSNRGDRS